MYVWHPLCLNIAVIFFCWVNKGDEICWWWMNTPPLNSCAMKSCICEIACPVAPWVTSFFVRLVWPSSVYCYLFYSNEAFNVWGLLGRFRWTGVPYQYVTYQCGNRCRVPCTKYTVGTACNSECLQLAAFCALFELIIVSPLEGENGVRRNFIICILTQFYSCD